MNQVLRAVPAIVESQHALAEADAEAFAGVLQKNWDGALLVARSAEKTTAGRPKIGGKPADKLSLTRFAERARVDRATVSKYLAAWERAAEADKVPPAEELEPGTSVDLSQLTAQHWDDWYNAKKERPEKPEPWSGGDLPAHELFVSDCAGLPNHVEAGSVDVFITDPPYPREFIGAYGELSKTAAALLKPGGLCVALAGQSYLADVLAGLSESLTYLWTVAYLTPGGQSAQLWERHVNTFWKPALVFSNGDYDGRWFGDVAKSEVNDNDSGALHKWGQSESGFADLVERFSAVGDLVCDPFLGSGTTALTALASGRRFVGCDMDEECVTTTRRRLGD